MVTIFGYVVFLLSLWQVTQAATGTSGVKPRDVLARVMLMWQVVHSSTCSLLPPSCANFAEMRFGEFNGNTELAVSL